MDTRLCKLIATEIAGTIRYWLDEHFDVTQKQDSTKINDPLDIVEKKIYREIYAALEAR